jgi:hypothetical protein
MTLQHKHAGVSKKSSLLQSCSWAYNVLFLCIPSSAKLGSYSVFTDGRADTI